MNAERANGRFSQWLGVAQIRRRQMLLEALAGTTGTIPSGYLVMLPTRTHCTLYSVVLTNRPSRP